MTAWLTVAARPADRRARAPRSDGRPSRCCSPLAPSCSRSPGQPDSPATVAAPREPRMRPPRRHRAHPTPDERLASSHAHRSRAPRDVPRRLPRLPYGHAPASARSRTPPGRCPLSLRAHPPRVSPGYARAPAACPCAAHHACAGREGRRQRASSTTASSSTTRSGCCWQPSDGRLLVTGWRAPDGRAATPPKDGAVAVAARGCSAAPACCSSRSSASPSRSSARASPAASRRANRPPRQPGQHPRPMRCRASRPNGCGSIEQAGRRFDIDWSFLASIGAQECGNGECAGTNSSGCAGPMQIAYVRGSACSPGAGTDAVGTLRRHRAPRPAAVDQRSGGRDLHRRADPARRHGRPADRRHLRRIPPGGV